MKFIVALAVCCVALFAWSLCVMAGRGRKEDNQGIPRLEILEQCRHFYMFRCCDSCPNGGIENCDIVADWKAALQRRNACQK